MLLSIDPGVNNCGIAVIDFVEDFTVLTTYNVSNSRKFTDKEKIIESEFGTRAVKVISIVSHVKRILDEYPGIDHVAIEAPFYSVLTPLAYGSLLEVISAIKYHVLIPRGITYTMVEPLLVKKIFIRIKLDKGSKKKEIMRQFLEKKVVDKEVILSVPVDTLTEHEIDAIAVGFSRAVTITEALKNDSN